MPPIDVNECQEVTECQQGCTNTPGSFECTCEPGFTLQGDGKTCDHKFFFVVHVWLFSNLNDITVDPH